MSKFEFFYTLFTLWFAIAGTMYNYKKDQIFSASVWCTLAIFAATTLIR